MQPLSGERESGRAPPPCWADLVLDGRFTYVLLDWALQQQEQQQQQQPPQEEVEGVQRASRASSSDVPSVPLAHLLLFLLCSDERRFVLHAPQPQWHSHSDSHSDSEDRELLIVRNSEHFLRSHPGLMDPRLSGSLGPGVADAVSFVVRRGVPLPALLAAPCSTAWRQFQGALAGIYGTTAFSSFRKLVVGSLRIDMRAVLVSQDMRPHLERFLARRHPGAVAACRLWALAADMLDGLEKRSGSSHHAGQSGVSGSATGGGGVLSTILTAAVDGAAHIQTALYSTTTTSTDDAHGAGADTSTAETVSHYDLWSLLGYSNAQHRPSGGQDSTSASAAAAHVKAHSDSAAARPYELLGAMVLTLRSIQRVIASKDRDITAASGDHHDVSPRHAHLRGPAPVSEAWSLSDGTQLELQTLSAMTAMIRSASSAESVEITYARTCVEKLHKVFRSVERESASALDSLYETFIASDEYFDLVASVRCRESPRVCEYRQFEDFIAQAKSLQQIRWRDSPDSRTFRLYAHTMSGPAQAQPGTSILEQLYSSVSDDQLQKASSTMDSYNVICAAGGVRPIALLSLLFLTGRHIVLMGGSNTLAESVKNVVQGLLDPIPVPHRVKVCVPSATGEDGGRDTTNAAAAVRGMREALGVSAGTGARRDTTLRGVFTADDTKHGSQPYCVITSHSVWDSFAASCGESTPDIFVFDLDSCQVKFDCGDSKLLNFCSSAVCHASSPHLHVHRKHHCLSAPFGRLLKTMGNATAIPCTSRETFVRNAFKTFFFEIILRFIPRRLEHFPESGVIACNVGELLSQAMKECKVCSSLAHGVHSDHKLFLESFVDSMAFDSLLDRHGAAFDAGALSKVRNNNVA